MIAAHLTRTIVCLLSAAAGTACVPLQLVGVIAGLISPNHGEAAGRVPVVNSQTATPPTPCRLGGRGLD